MLFANSASFISGSRVKNKQVCDKIADRTDSDQTGSVGVRFGPTLSGRSVLVY